MSERGVDLQQRRRFDDLYQANYSAIFRYVLRRLAPGSKPDDAADVTADVFATAWKRIDKIPAAPNDRLWLYGVGRRALQHQRRSHARRKRLMVRLHSEGGIGQKETGGQTFDDERVRAAIAALRPSDREVLYLVVWDGLDNSGAARVLGCSTNTVAVRLHRARARLRALLPDEMSVENDEEARITKES